VALCYVTCGFTAVLWPLVTLRGLLLCADIVGWCIVPGSSFVHEVVLTYLVFDIGNLWE